MISIGFQMAFTFQQIILDAGKLVNDISQQESTADMLICEIQSVCNQIEGMKQVSSKHVNREFANIYLVVRLVCIAFF